MHIDLTTPAIIFSVVSLLMLAYTNKFLALASITRQLTNRAVESHDRDTLKQIKNLRMRINLLKATQAFGLLSLLQCLVSIVCLFYRLEEAGDLLFLGSLFFMMISVILSFFETLISGNALKIELKKIEEKI